MTDKRGVPFASCIFVIDTVIVCPLTALENLAELEPSSTASLVQPSASKEALALVKIASSQCFPKTVTLALFVLVASTLG